ncbi:YihY/virulence factor BrkB family protein [Acidimangrovimonas pyrenivorans]|uniref:YihY/virulence factor BrkB family protein n=1 Tax=Acidimangrovimonas pyrenivorans TaxID=2030798 RepID=A0ABV7AD84_9RHOB
MLQTVIGVVRIVGDSKLGLIAAGVAFFAMLAIFPGVAAVIALWGYVYDPSVILGQTALLADFLPPSAFAILKGQVETLVAANNSALGWASIFSTLFALWSARSGVAALMQGLNTIHGTRDRGGFWHIVAALVLTLVLIGVALTALALVIVLPIVLAFFPLGGWAAQALVAGQWIMALAVVLLGIALVYRYGPNREGVRTPWLSPGLALAVVLWAVASLGFSYYIANFGSYNRIYGSIGAVIALLMWFYISAYVILLGAALNEEIEAERPHARYQ